MVVNYGRNAVVCQMAAGNEERSSMVRKWKYLMVKFVNIFFLAPYSMQIAYV